LNSRIIRSFDESHLFFKSNKSKTCLSFEPDSYPGPRGWDNRDLKGEVENIIAAWNEDSFGIVANSEFQFEGHSVANLLRDMHAAFMKKDIAIWLSASERRSLSRHYGLVVAIASRCS
jgi:hypothetical protein